MLIFVTFKPKMFNKNMVIMRRFFLVIVLTMMAWAVVFAGEIKVLKTEPVDILFDENGVVCVQVNVEMQLANIKKDEYSVAVIMDNKLWPDELTYEEFFNLVKKRCFSETFLPAISTRVKRTIKVFVPFESYKFSRKEGTMYLKAYVFKLEPIDYVTEGVMMQFEPDYQAISDAQFTSSMAELGSFFGSLLGGGGFGRPKKEIPKNAESCYWCDGTGECSSCMGSGSTDSGTCSSCRGSGYCVKCSGRGYNYTLMPIK